MSTIIGRIVLSNEDSVHEICCNTSDYCFVNDWSTDLCRGTMPGSLIKERYRMGEVLDIICAQSAITISEVADILRTIKILTWSSAHKRCLDKRLRETIDDNWLAPLKLLGAHQAHCDILSAQLLWDASR